MLEAVRFHFSFNVKFIFETYFTSPSMNETKNKDLNKFSLDKYLF